MSKGKKSIQGSTNIMIKDRQTQREQQQEKKTSNQKNDRTELQQLAGGKAVGCANLKCNRALKPMTTSIKFKECSERVLNQESSDLLTNALTTGPVSVLALTPGWGWGDSQKNWMGVCGPLPETLTLFQTNLSHFRPDQIFDSPISDLFQLLHGWLSNLRRALLMVLSPNDEVVHVVSIVRHTRTVLV